MPQQRIYKIENDTLKVEVNKTGAELFSLFHKSSQTEYLWQGNETFWGSRAPVLFPIIGALKQGEIWIKGKKCSIPKHGIIRKNEELSAEQINDGHVRFMLEGNSTYNEIYPYKFSFALDFMLEENSLTVQFTVTNKDEDAMHFSLGGHPAFCCPLTPEDQYEDYELEFEQPEQFLSSRINAEGLLMEQKESVAEPSKTLSLTKSMFDKDALIFTDLKSRNVSLKKKTGEKIVTVSYPAFPHLGIWSKPGAPFICIEPWIGYNDPIQTTQKIEQKPGMIKLESGKSFEAAFTISIEG